MRCLVSTVKGFCLVLQGSNYWMERRRRLQPEPQRRPQCQRVANTKHSSHAMDYVGVHLGAVERHYI